MLNTAGLRGHLVNPLLVTLRCLCLCSHVPLSGLSSCPSCSAEVTLGHSRGWAEGPKWGCPPSPKAPSPCASTRGLPSRLPVSPQQRSPGSGKSPGGTSGCTPTHKHTHTRTCIDVRATCDPENCGTPCGEGCWAGDSQWSPRPRVRGDLCGCTWWDTLVLHRIWGRDRVLGARWCEQD